MVLVKLLRKVMIAFLSFMTYLMGIVAPIWAFATYFHHDAHYFSLSSLSILLFGLFFGGFFISSIIFTRHYDKYFYRFLKEGVKDKSDVFVMNIAPIPTSWIVELRFVRGALYEGVILFHLIKMQPLPTAQRILLFHTDFIKMATPFHKTFTAIHAIIILLTAVIWGLSLIWS